MIIPTPEFDPLFANDGVPFRTKMLQYIQREFADLKEAQNFLLMGDEGLNDLSVPLIFPIQPAPLRNAA